METFSFTLSLGLLSLYSSFCSLPSHFTAWFNSRLSMHPSICSPILLPICPSICTPFPERGLGGICMCQVPFWAPQSWSRCPLGKGQASDGLSCQYPMKSVIHAMKKKHRVLGECTTKSWPRLGKSGNLPAESDVILLSLMPLAPDPSPCCLLSQGHSGLPSSAPLCEATDDLMESGMSTLSGPCWEEA